MIAVAALGAACGPESAPPPPATAAERAPAPGRALRGIASWYGEPHHGRLTASGEVFDMFALTAAHRTLPLGTRLRVTHLRNGLQVVVRINDRGPGIPGRILDLSYAAARRLDGVASGLMPVRVEVLAG